MPTPVPVAPSAESDPWVDADFAPLDTRTGPQHVADVQRIADPQNVNEPLEPEQPPTPSPSITDEPEVIQVKGGIITISHDKKGWHGVLELDDGGGKETFHGATQKELMANVLEGKLNATAQIRKLNKKLKLGTVVAPPEPVNQPQAIVPKQLSADEVFQLKTELQNDPDKAFELWFQKKFGLSAAQLVAMTQEANHRSKKGEEAYEELSIESVSKEFLESHKDEYYAWPENGENMMTWLCRHKLNRQVTSNDNFGTISAELLRKGLYTVENLEEAFEDLKDSGLLIPPPEPDPVPVAVTPAPAIPIAVRPTAQPANPRIAATRRQPRGGLGIRPSEVSSSLPAPDEGRAPSVEELDNLSPKELNALYQQTIRTAQQQKYGTRR